MCVTKNECIEHLIPSMELGGAVHKDGLQRSQKRKIWDLLSECIEHSMHSKKVVRKYISNGSRWQVCFDITK